MLVSAFGNIGYIIYYSLISKTVKVIVNLHIKISHSFFQGSSLLNVFKVLVQ